MSDLIIVIEKMGNAMCCGGSEDLSQTNKGKPCSGHGHSHGHGHDHAHGQDHAHGNDHAHANENKGTQDQAQTATEQNPK